MCLGVLFIHLTLTLYALKVGHRDSGKMDSQFVCHPKLNGM